LLLCNLVHSPIVSVPVQAIGKVSSLELARLAAMGWAPRRRNEIALGATGRLCGARRWRSQDRNWGPRVILMLRDQELSNQI
jgi:hypothetical protein